MTQVVLVTGSSHGIGLATVEHLARAGYRVYATARNPEQATELHQLAAKVNNIFIDHLDVNSDISVKLAVDKIIAKEKKIDVLINNAGNGIYGPAETLTIDEIKQQFDTNVLGVMRVTHAVLPIMRDLRKGRIINISSVSGVVPSRNLPVYSACKAALESLTASYASNLSDFGIKFISIQPGPVVTDFEPRTPYGSRFKANENPYLEMVQNNRAAWKRMMDGGQTTAEVAKVIHKALEDKNPDLWYQTDKKVTDLFSLHYKDPTGNTRIPKGNPPIIPSKL